MDTRTLAPTASCKICTIRLETLCYQRAWWFRVFREILAGGIRHFRYRLSHSPEGLSRALADVFQMHSVPQERLKERSALFNWLDSYLNPMFNHVRNSLLTAEELENARALARRAADRDFIEREQ